MGIQTGDNVILGRVTFDVIIPNGVATEQEISDWLRFYVGHHGRLPLSNPLSDQEPEVVPGTIQWDVVTAGVMG